MKKKKHKKTYVVAWHYKIHKHTIFIVDFKRKKLLCCGYERKIPKGLYKKLGIVK